MTETIVKGIGVSDGIRFGKALLYTPFSLQDESIEEFVSTEEVKNEINRLSLAKEKSLLELDDLIEQTKQSLGEEKAVILTGQQSFLADPVFYPEIEKLINNHLYSAEKAVKQVVDHFVSLFEGMANEYLRERSADIRDVGRRLLSHLQEKKDVQLSNLVKEEVILVADDLTPSDTVQLDKKFVLGFVTRVGGKTSHTAILSRSLGIAAVVGAGDGLASIQNGDFLIIDGSSGLCIINPNTQTTQEYKTNREKELEQHQFLQDFAFKPALTADGFQVEIAANIGTAMEAKPALANGAEGIGLYRTEFLFMNADRMPDEEEQYRAYKEVAEIMGDKPVIIRTLDIGGDKELPYLSLPKEMNPFLGYRAIRLCLDNRELFITQLRAILRASAYGKIKIMFPMISGLDEWKQAKAIYEEVRFDLKKEGIPFDEFLQLGIMVEIPSTALLADLFAKEVDFFSIGTNDLVQYSLAADRMNEKVAYLYDHFHPAVLRLIKGVIEASHKEGKWVGMCGGMAGDPLAAPLLIGFGLDEWSMDIGSVKKVKHVISRVDRQKCRNLVNELLQLDNAEKIRKRLEEIHSM